MEFIINATGPVPDKFAPFEVIAGRAFFADSPELAAYELDLADGAESVFDRSINEDDGENEDVAYEAYDAAVDEADDADAEDEDDAVDEAYADEDGPGGVEPDEAEDADDAEPDEAEDAYAGRDE